MNEVFLARHAWSPLPAWLPPCCLHACWTSDDELEHPHGRVQGRQQPGNLLNSTTAQQPSAQTGAHVPSRLHPISAEAQLMSSHPPSTFSLREQVAPRGRIADLAVHKTQTGSLTVPAVLSCLNAADALEYANRFRNAAMPFSGHHLCSSMPDMTETAPEIPYLNHDGSASFFLAA